MMFDEGPDHTGCSFRPEGEFPAAPVLEDIHFFLDDIGAFPEGPLKQIHRLKGGGADLLIPEAPKKRAGDPLQKLEVRCIGGENVMGASNRLELYHGQELYDTNKHLSLRGVSC